MIICYVKSQYLSESKNSFGHYLTFHIWFAVILLNENFDQEYVMSSHATPGIK